MANSSKKQGQVEVTKKNRFVLSKKMFGQGLTIEFTNKKGETYTYEHDKVFAKLPDTAKACFEKYGNYTNSNKLPNWAK
jgi:hypothetical protein